MKKPFIHIARLLICSIAPSVGFAQTGIPTKPPLAQARPVTDDYFGIKIADPYRYLETRTDPQTQSWMKAQADFARSTLDRISGRDAYLADMAKYIDAAPALVFDVHRTFDRHYFFLKTLTGESVGKLYMRAGLDGKDTLLVDTDQFTGPHGEPPAINYFTPSNDARYVAFGVSQGGSENATLHIVDTQTRKLLPETIDREEYGDVAWLPGDQSFFYNRLQELGPGVSPVEKYLKSKVYLHHIGESVDKDAVVFGIGVSPRVEIAPMDDEWVDVQPGSQYAIGVVEHGVRLEKTMYVAPLASVGTVEAPWIKICDVDAGVSDLVLHGDDLYLLTHDDAPRFKILRIDLKHPDLANAVVVLPHGKTVLRGITGASDALYVSELDAGIYHIVRVPYRGTPERLKLPVDGTAEIGSSDPRSPGIVFDLSGWIRGSKIYEYDPANPVVKATDLQPAGPYDNLDDLVSVEVKAPSYDQTPVPLSIIYKRGIKLDGSNPTVLMAYGGYGITMDPGFNPGLLAWLNRGGIYAVAHVRGGGENGEEWHQGAFKLTKPNVWRDTIACAQYLIAEKYTSASHLGVTGGSNGGITVGRAITERPDLFAAAAIRAGAVNILRFETDANGIPNVPEFGSIKTQEGFEDLYAMDAYEHVRTGVKYPAVLLTTGINDPRVPPWMPAKMAARLQADTSGDKPILLSIDYQGGHGIGASKRQREQQNTDVFSFFLWQFGDPAFQPK